MAKLVPGVNDLATLFPEVAKEAYGWDPTTVTAGSNQKKTWWCKKGHPYSSTVKNRTANGSGCGVCNGQQVLAGYNDLATHYPDVAAEAFDWDPTTVTKRSKLTRKWHCKRGHTWEATVLNRTPPTSTSCPFCTGRKALAGFNDLETLCPEVAAQAEGWDPKSVTLGSGEEKKWRCEKGHTWKARVVQRTPPANQGCPVCAGRQVLTGFNDLSTLFPEVAKEADGWDPTTVTVGSGKKLPWRCARGHTWRAVVNDRTPPRLDGCPVCTGREVLVGFNDLATLFPEVANQADGWDPKTVTSKSRGYLSWCCEKGHTWSSRVADRTPPKSNGCPTCSGRQVLAGFNDLASLYPEVASQADGWDPKSVTPGSGQKLPWRCEKGHRWTATVANRTPPTSSDCPECAEFGFKPSLPAWFYLLQRPGEQQLGVTNYKEERLRTHAKYGWSEVEVVGPFPGEEVLETEKQLKRWLRKEVGLVPGTHENWFTSKLEVRSLTELKAKSGVETDLF